MEEVAQINTLLWEAGVCRCLKYFCTNTKQNADRMQQALETSVHQLWLEIYQVGESNIIRLV